MRRNANLVGNKSASAIAPAWIARLEMSNACDDTTWDALWETVVADGMCDHMQPCNMGIFSLSPNQSSEMFPDWKNGDQHFP